MLVVDEILENGCLVSMLLDLTLVEAEEIAVVSAAAEEFFGRFVVIFTQRTQSLFSLLISLQLIGFVVVIAALDIVRRGAGAIEREEVVRNLVGNYISIFTGGQIVRSIHMVMIAPWVEKDVVFLYSLVLVMDDQDPLECEVLRTSMSSCNNALSLAAASGVCFMPKRPVSSAPILKRVGEAMVKICLLFAATGETWNAVRVAVRVSRR